MLKNGIKAGEGTWRGSFKPVAGLVLSCFLMSPWAKILFVQVLFQFVEALGRRQIHKTVQKFPVLSPGVAHLTSQVSVEDNSSLEMVCDHYIYITENRLNITSLYNAIQFSTSNYNLMLRVGIFIVIYSKDSKISFKFCTYRPTLSAPRSGSDLRIWWKSSARSLGGVFQDRRKSSACHRTFVLVRECFV